MMNKEEEIKSLQSLLDLEEYAVKFDKEMLEKYYKQVKEREAKIEALKNAIEKVEENK